MKHKKQIYYIILVFVTLTGMWIVPSLVKKATYSPTNYPFVYYSSVLEELGIVDRKNKEFPLTDLHGNKYTMAQFDSLMPLLNYRQLMTDGKLPDSIGGYEITPQLLRSKSVTFRYVPEMKQTPDPGLYILLETMPKRVGLEMPDDVFRLENYIEFIDANTNTVDTKKSDLFQKALNKESFVFPPQWLSGNPNPRKSYDEGYFILDAEDNLFHMKMVNNRPFIRNTKVSNQMDIAHFSIQEVSDKRFYGFVFDKKGNIYTLEGNEGKYETVKLDIDPVDISRDQVTIIGNLLYWTVWVTTPQGRHYYALESQTLKQTASYVVERENNKWDTAAKWLFPYYLTFENPNNNYILPEFHFTGLHGFGIHILLAIAGFFLLKRRKLAIFSFGCILVTGIAGFIALWIVPDFRN